MTALCHVVHVVIVFVLRFVLDQPTDPELDFISMDLLHVDSIFVSIIVVVVVIVTIAGVGAIGKSRNRCRRMQQSAVVIHQQFVVDEQRGESVRGRRSSGSRCTVGFPPRQHHFERTRQSCRRSNIPTVSTSATILLLLLMCRQQGPHRIPVVLLLGTASTSTSTTTSDSATTDESVVIVQYADAVVVGVYVDVHIIQLDVHHGYTEIQRQLRLLLLLRLLWDFTHFHHGCFVLGILILRDHWKVLGNTRGLLGFSWIAEPLDTVSPATAAPAQITSKSQTKSHYPATVNLDLGQTTDINRAPRTVTTKLYCRTTSKTGTESYRVRL